jgi:uncharacterized protein (TIGR02588 family)
MKVQKNALEWSVFAVSLALIGGVVAALLYAQFTSHDRPPSVHAALGTPTRAGDGFAVPLEVRNEGDATAAEVEIEVTLTSGDAVERSTAVLAFVPHGSTRRAWVGFRHDPSRGRLHARVVGYREP